MKGIATLCALVITLAGCGSERVDVTPTSQISPQTNSQYIKKVAKQNDGLKKYTLAEHISEMLGEVEHINPEPYEGDAELMNTPTAYELKRFKKKNLIKVYYLLEALNSSDFRQKIGEELEKDRNDTSAEYGGILHLLEDGSVKIQMLPSDPLKCNLYMKYNIGSLADYRYCLPDINPTVDKLAVFHFHSDGLSTALSPGDAGVVFSRIDENTFNVDIGLHSKGQMFNLDLGVYKY